MLRVTEVLTPFLGLDKIPRHYLEAAADRGTRVHNAIDGMLQGMPPLHIEDDIAGYLKSYEQWTAFPTVFREERYSCEELGITGQIDLIGRGPEGNLWVIDYKTSAKPSCAWSLQVSAYCELAKRQGIIIAGGAILHLKRDGGPPSLIAQPNHWELYKSCLDVYKHFFNKRKDDADSGWDHI